MKKFVTYLIIAFIAISNTSCNDEEDMAMSTIQNHLIGSSWDLTETITKESIGDKETTTSKVYPDEDGNYISYTFEDEDDMIYTQNNSKDISKVFAVYCKYTFENNRLTIVKKNSYDVVLLNSTSLVLATTKESDGKKITTTNIFKLRERNIY